MAVAQHEAVHRAEPTFRAKRHARLGLLASLALARFVRLYRKYSEDQPRDERGRWTGAGKPADEGDDDGLTTGAVVVDNSRGRTGNFLIDSHTALFERKLVEIIERLGPGAGHEFGTRVHKELADWVRIPDFQASRRNKTTLKEYPF